MPATSTAATESSRELVITRVFDAPRALVFKVWTQPEHLSQWWGPHGFTVLQCEMDFRVGGGWYIRMRSAEGREDRQRGVIREIVAPQLLVFTYAFEDERGQRGHETVVTVTFAEVGGKTMLTLHQAIFESDEVRNDHVRGWGEALERLTEYVLSASIKE
ncbi:MAG TPA: SRPBCC domain-containing protein [Candidatus Binataceae bacterium]|nr:SRPBCC domain-containing protein [Candidatus Binataceae bacterium]